MEKINEDRGIQRILDALLIFAATFCILVWLRLLPQVSPWAPVPLLAVSWWGAMPVDLKKMRTGFWNLVVVIVGPIILSMPVASENLRVAWRSWLILVVALLLVLLLMGLALQSAVPDPGG